MTSPEWPPVSDAEVKAAARVLGEWGLRSRHGEWTDAETRATAAKEALTAARSALPEAGTVGHEFDEDVADASMCMCGVPALTHDMVYARTTPPTPPSEGDALTHCANCGGEVEVSKPHQVGTCSPPSEAGDVEAAVAAERERIALAIERAAADEGYAYGGVGFGRIAARIARTPTATEGG